MDESAGVTQEQGHTRFPDLPSALFALTFIARRIQQSLSLVDRELEFYVPASKSFSTRWTRFCFVLFLFLLEENPSLCECTEIRTHVPKS